jgi:cobalt-zinc-cadmium efflux system protein
MVDHSGHAMVGRDRANDRALKIAGWLTGVYFVIELGIGLYTGSIAVISDAFHTFSARRSGSRLCSRSYRALARRP